MFRDDSEALRARLAASDARVEELARTRERLDALEKELIELRDRVYQSGAPPSCGWRRLGRWETAVLGGWRLLPLRPESATSCTRSCDERSAIRFAFPGFAPCLCTG